MTDYQFRFFIRLILSIAESKSDLKEFTEELKKLLDERDEQPA
jgi:hypothetical protein